MKSRSLALWCALTCLLFCLSGCTTPNAKKDGLITDQYRIPAHFKYIPADTAFVVTDFSPLPYDQFEWLSLEPVAEMIAAVRATASKEMANMPPDSIQMEQRLVLAVLDELDGNVSAEGFKRMGLATQGHYAFYSIGAFPVMRMELSNAKAFEAVFARVEAKVGQRIPQKKLGPLSYRSIDLEEFVLPIMITDRELIIGFTHKKFEADYLAYVTGAKQFPKTLANDNRLLDMVKKYKFTPYMAGYVDLKGIGDSLLGVNTTSLLHTSLVTSGANFPTDIPAECVSEISGMLATSPRIVYGYNKITRSSISAAVGLETTSPFIKGMGEAVTSLQAFDSEMDKKALFSMHFGLDLKKALAVLRDQAQAIQSQPYKCSDLRALNEAAREAYFSASNMPTWALDLQGLSFILGDLDFDMQASKLNRIAMLLMIRSANPSNLFDTIKLAIPELASMALKPDGKPVSFQLPAQAKTFAPTLEPPHLAMSKDYLGIALGGGVLGSMSKIMAAGAKDSPLLAFGYNMTRFYEIISKAIPQGALSGDEGALMNSMLKVYKTIGQSRFDLDITPNGVFSNSSIEFIPSSKKSPASK